MATHQKPEIGDWYINADGQFVRTWGLIYEQGQLDKVIIQQLNGKRHHLGLNDWHLLDLVRYPMPDEQGNNTKNSAAPHP